MTNVPIYAKHFSANELDLESVIFKLCHPRGGEWRMDKARSVERDYRRWLYMHVVYPDVNLVPTEDIDEMWHTHILDTEAYAADCSVMFGHYLHHFPYAGMLGEGDMEIHRKRAEQTGVIYKALFGVELNGLPVECTNCCDTAPAGTRRPRIADLQLLEA